MPRTVGNLWERVIEFDALYAAYQRAERGHRERTAVINFRARLEENLIALQNELIWHTWRPSEPQHFMIQDPKPRSIAAPAFRDRVVHHVLVAAIEPVFERRFISDSYACRIGKGTHAAVNRVQQMLRNARAKWNTVYVLKGDVKSYFKSVDHSVLKDINRRSIRDKDILWMLDRIIDAGGNNGKGLDIGALTSQLEANVYADQLDHMAKDVMRLPYYVRYMDDFVVILPEKAALGEALLQINGYMHDRLKLTLNPKTAIFPASQGVDFCGYRLWTTHRLPRKRNVTKIHRRLRKMSGLYAQGKIRIERAEQVIASYLGYMKHCNGYTTTKKFLQELVFRKGE